jgi:signal transduction histidine kinase
MNTLELLPDPAFYCRPGLPGKTALVVDDEEIIRETLKIAFINSGLSVTTAASGEEALQILKEQHFDLIITDLRMERTDGLEVLKIAKAFAPETSVIILTGFGDMASAIDALRMGADDYLLKPCDPDELLFRLGRCLEKQNLLQKLRINNQELKQEIFEHRKTTEELNNLADNFAQANSELQAFNRAVSHDLQEPLYLILVFAKRLLHKYGTLLPTRGQEYLNHIQNAAGRMQILIHSLLQYAKLNSASAPRCSVDLSRTITDVLADLQLRIEETGASVTIDRLPVVKGDPVQLHQLLLNLIANSLKYHRCGIAPRIKIQCLPGDKIDGEKLYHRLIIQDNGIGFDRQDSETIFGLFKRLHGNSEYGGTGIGLSICRKIVEGLGGTLTAEGERDKGAKFTITLPVNA